jgi:transcriptional regulator with XRE-family HTH domain
MEKQSAEIVGKRIREIRLSLGKSMMQFARLIDNNDPNGRTKSGAVTNWETGTNYPNAQNLKKIAELGGVSVEFLLTGVSEVTKDYIHHIAEEVFLNTNSQLHKEYAESKQLLNGEGLYDLFHYIKGHLGYSKTKADTTEFINLLVEKTYDKLMKGSRNQTDKPIINALYSVLTELNKDEYKTSETLVNTIMGYAESLVILCEDELEDHKGSNNVTDEVRELMMSFHAELEVMVHKYNTELGMVPHE